jgi:predicted dehydrogenase
MMLTPDQEAAGRRTFLKALAGTPALAALGAAAAFKGPVPGGPVRLGFIGVGGQGGFLLTVVDKNYATIKAIADINPGRFAKADENVAKAGHAPAKHYSEWKEMLEKEDIEAVVVAVPLWAHADVVVGCLEAGKHVLCEKMMAWDVAGAERMREAARKNKRVLEIAYQRFYNPMYLSAHEGIIKAGVIGDVYHARLAWHRNANWRRKGEPPSKDYDPAKWGYPTWEHLLNWRLYWKYSQGLFAELASHQVSVVNWFFGTHPEAVLASGSVSRFKDGREVYDHCYATFEYAGGRTACFSSLESNAFDDYYETYYGTKGTLILKRESEAMLFMEGKEGSAATSLELAAKTSGPVLESSETQASAGGPSLSAAGPQQFERRAGNIREIQGFCSAIRVGTPLRCGPDRAFESARACILANQAAEKKSRITV